MVWIYPVEIHLLQVLGGVTFSNGDSVMLGEITSLWACFGDEREAHLFLGASAELSFSGKGGSRITWPEKNTQTFVSLEPFRAQSKPCMCVCVCVGSREGFASFMLEDSIKRILLYNQIYSLYT